MHLMRTFFLNSYCVYQVLRHSKRELSVFPPKNVTSYQDYSVDFFHRLSDGERVVSGTVLVHGLGLRVESVLAHDRFLTAFISGGRASHSYCLTYTAQTDRGRSVIQEMILSTFGHAATERREERFISMASRTRPPDIRPPLNGIKLIDRYLLDDNGFFICI